MRESAQSAGKILRCLLADLPIGQVTLIFTESSFKLQGLYQGTGISLLTFLREDNSWKIAAEVVNSMP